MKVLAFTILSVSVLSGCASKPSFNRCTEAASFYTAQIDQKLVEPVAYEPNRVLLPNSMMTRDYRLDRLNIYIDENHVIMSAQCG